jgi:hypothetical protein
MLFHDPNAERCEHLRVEPGAYSQVFCYHPNMVKHVQNTLLIERPLRPIRFRQSSRHGRLGTVNCLEYRPSLTGGPNRDAAYRVHRPGL